MFSSSYETVSTVVPRVCLRWDASYPGDGERHVEVFPPLQPEAPGRRAVQRHHVRAHLRLNVNTPADCPLLLSVPVLSPVPASLLSSALVSLLSLPCPSWRWWGWVGQERWNLCGDGETGTNPCRDQQIQLNNNTLNLLRDEKSGTQTLKRC